MSTRSMARGGKMKKINEIDSRLVSVEMWMRSAETSIRDVRNNQWEYRKELHELMVSFLVEAGILVEDKEPSARTIFWDNKRYKVKKVK